MKKDGLSIFHSPALSLVVAALMVGHAAAQSPRRPNEAFGSGQPIVEPAIFAEGIISTRDYESSVSFTPDGRTVYFVKSTPDLSLRVILVSHFDGGRWRTPEVASFSGQYTDTDPCLSPDGTKLFFVSRRSVTGATPKADADIWMVERTSIGWSEAHHLDAPVNSESQETSPALTADGTLYFSSNRAGGKGAADIYRSRIVEGKYTTPENLGETVNTPSPELQVFVTPDERVLIFAGAGRADSQGGIDLYLSLWRNGAWSKASNLGNKINSTGADTAPRISPDGRYFFWASTRGYGFADQQEKRLTYRELSNRLRSARNSLGDIYQIDIGELPLKQ
jgi:Tol biopolymer transport system component